MEGCVASEIDHLYHVEKFMESVTDLDQLLEAIINESSLALNTESSSLALYDEEDNELHFFVARGSGQEKDFEKKLAKIHIKMNSGVIGWSAKNRKPIIINNAYENPLFDQGTDKETGFATRSILAVPMIRGEKLIGVIETVIQTDSMKTTRNYYRCWRLRRHW